MFDKSTRSKQVCQLLLSLIVGPGFQILCQWNLNPTFQWLILGTLKGLCHGSPVHFPITRPQLLWNLKYMQAKKLHVIDKIRDPTQTNISPEHYF